MLGLPIVGIETSSSFAFPDIVMPGLPIVGIKMPTFSLFSGIVKPYFSFFLGFIKPH